MYGLIFVSIIVASIVLCGLLLVCFLVFLEGFGERRRNEGYVNMDENLFLAWSYDKGYWVGGIWTRFFRGGRKKVDHGRKYMNRRYGNE